MGNSPLYVLSVPLSWPPEKTEHHLFVLVWSCIDNSGVDGAGVCLGPPFNYLVGY
jgi:hypothetical protein